MKNSYFYPLLTSISRSFSFRLKIVPVSLFFQSTYCRDNCGAEGIRTLDLGAASATLSQLSYSPMLKKYTLSMEKKQVRPEALLQIIPLCKIKIEMKKL